MPCVGVFSTPEYCLFSRRPQIYGSTFVIAMSPDRSPLGKQEKVEDRRETNEKYMNLSLMMLLKCLPDSSAAIIAPGVCRPSQDAVGGLNLPLSDKILYHVQSAPGIALGLILSLTMCRELCRLWLTKQSSQLSVPDAPIHMTQAPITE